MKIKKILTSLIAASVLFSSAITYVSAQDLTNANDNTSSIISNEKKTLENPIIKEAEKKENKSEEIKEEKIDIKVETLKNVEERSCCTKSVSFIKRDITTNAPLEGATFTLYHKVLSCQNWNQKQNCTTTTDGIISFGNLSVGYYKIEETTPPSGYIKSGGAYEFNITIIGTNNFSQSSAENMFKNKKNPFPQTISFTKHGKTGDNKPITIPGALFKLYKDDVESSSQTSGTDGLVSFEITQEGNYTIREDDAPDGYTKSDFNFNFTVDNDGNVSYTAEDLKAAEVAFTNKAEIVPEKPHTTFVKYDNLNYPLPNAVFSLSCNGVTKQFKSDSYGVVDFGVLENGSYIITEYASPAGYAVSGNSYSFNVIDCESNFNREHASLTFINTRIVTPPTPSYPQPIWYVAAPIEPQPYLEIITISEPAPAPPVSNPPKTGDTTLPIAIPTAMFLLATAMLIIKRKLAKKI